MKRTVNIIKEKLSIDQGIYRYENDDYDGWMYTNKDNKNNIHRNKGGGYWPLLNFWMCTYLIESGKERKALKYYNKVIDDLAEKKYIPEQIFNNCIQASISPLCWSHAMFIIASKRLKFLE